MAYDLSIFFGSAGASSFQLNQAALSGVQKVAQTFLFLLLADDSEVGSTFVADICGNNKTRDDEVLAIFSLAEYSIRTYLLPLEEDASDEERFSSAALVDWEAEDGTASFTIEIKNKVGDAVIVGTPKLEI